MSEQVVGSVVTSNGMWSKSITDNGNFVYKNPNGQYKSQQSYAAAASHRISDKVKDGEISTSEGMQQSFVFDNDRSKIRKESGTNIRDGTAIPARLYRGVYDRGSVGRKRIKRINQWVGFRDKKLDQLSLAERQALSKDEAVEQIAEEYFQMVEKLDMADSVSEQQQIKRDYGIGGSP